MADNRESALVIELPELDDVLDEHRSVLDPSAQWGMPAHLTLLYPFMLPAKVDSTVMANVAEAAAGTSRFEAEFAGFGWFADRVLWLAPSQPRPFKELMLRMMDAFPACLPYGGAFNEIVPHVTIAEGGQVHRLQAAIDAIQPQLPLRAQITSVSLMAGSREPASWRVIERVALN